MRTHLIIGLALSCSACSKPSGQANAPEEAPATNVEIHERSLQADASCARDDVALQVLGSGGPKADDDRASSGYLIWVDGRSRFLIDAGGGTFQRFGAVGARIEDLDAVAISHLHVDHSADLVALLKAGYFVDRERPLPVIGPTGSPPFPAFDRYLQAMIGAEQGAYGYLSGYLSDEDGWFSLEVQLADAHAGLDDPTHEPTVVLRGEDWSLSAVGVHHGHAPALGFLLEAAGRKFAFGGDQNADSKAFERMARGADVLVAHHAIGSDAGTTLQSLHRTPAQLATLAEATQPQMLVLSHHMQRALQQRAVTKQLITERYAGPLHFADDLDCYAIE